MIEGGYCRECKHWADIPDRRVAFNTEYMPDEWGCCLITEHGRGQNKAEALPSGDEWSDNAILSTAPEFGCVQFEAEE